MTPPLQQLAAHLDRHCQRLNGSHPTAIPDLTLFRRTSPNEWTPAVYELALFIIAQGHKQVRLADEVHNYDPAHYVLSSVDLPVMCRVTQASEAQPYLSLRITLDRVILGELLAQETQSPPTQSTCGLAVTSVENELLDAILRLLSLLDKPQDIPILAPLILREVSYRVLNSPHGPRLRQIAASGATGQRIAEAITAIRKHATEAIRVDDLASQVGMGSSAFHKHFKAITGMTPLQYQKRLRLQHARNLMLASGATAAQAAFEVGYESASQFSREYRREYGQPPKADILSLQT